MTIRPFILPNDLDLMNSLVMEGFQYPENPDWSVRADEKEGMVDRIQGAKRMWPLLRALQLFSPALRDVIQGFIDEEDDKPAALVNYSKPPNSADQWFIANVTVLPAYRRRGIARKLVEATIAKLRVRGARYAILEVVEGNTPAFKLYQELGFETYAGSIEYSCPADMTLAFPALPDGWSLTALPNSEWRARYELALRTTPENAQKYEPIRESRFQMSLLVRIFGKLFDAMGGTKGERFILRAPSGEVAGIALTFFRTRPGGVNHADFAFDSKFSEIAKPFTQHILAHIQQVSPGRRIEVSLDNWQAALARALEALGCTKRLATHRMGMEFSND